MASTTAPAMDKISEQSLPEFPLVPADPKVIVLEYSDLLAGKDLRVQINEAFGEGGLGICAVRGVPGFEEARGALLPCAWRLAHQPEEVLAKYELPKACYTFGWSRGREKFQGKPDVGKGSFYANPLFDDPADGNEEVREKYPYAASENVWPSEVPDLEAAFKNLGRIMYDAAKPVVAQCEALVAARCGPDANTLTKDTFENSKLVCGRLLHYYPGIGGDGTWCGWHNDNSVITCLCPAMFLNDNTGEEVADFKSNTAGLYVKSRDGRIVKAKLPNDCLGLQIGEAAQIMSGGVLHATPHFVQGHDAKPDEAPISRETFAMFIEPAWDAPIGPPTGRSRADVIQGEELELIPPLSRRWKPNNEDKVLFGQFLGDSFQEYYQHNNPGEELPSAA